MCPKCREIFKVWNKGNKTPEDVDLLSREVPERFTEVHRYFDDDAQTIVYVMQCKHCEQTYHVPH